MDSLFQKSLNDVLKSLRLQSGGGFTKSTGSSGSKAATDAFLQQVYKDSLRECKSGDQQTKATALLKLLYLHMAQGSDLQPAAFHCVEAMSAPRFSSKEVGYLVGSECLQEKPDMLLLATHLLRKDLASPNQLEASLALSCLSCVCSADLALHIAPDVLNLLQSSRAMVRRKATLSLLRMVQRSPETLKTAFRALLERLEDSNPAVVTAAVCVFCELALHDPPAFLRLAPNLVPLLTPSTSPWVAIKLVKIIGSMAVVEPRLVRKVQEPLSSTMESTSSKSLLLECIRVVFSCMPQNDELRLLALAKAAELLGTGDANLRYLCLQALLSVLPTYAADVGAHKAAIIACFDHPDASIQSFTLRLVASLVSESSLIPTVSVLRTRLPSADLHLANEIEASILSMCTFDSYSRIADFDWYLDVLLDLCYLASSRQGLEIGRQLVDLAVCVPSLRPNLVKSVNRLVMDTAVLAPRPTAVYLLTSASMILGELGVAEGEVLLEGDGLRGAVDSLLQPALVKLPPILQAVYVQAAMKLVLKAASGPWKGERGERLVSHALQLLQPFEESSHLEVQERAYNAAVILGAILTKGCVQGAGDHEIKLGELMSTLQENILASPLVEETSLPSERTSEFEQAPTADFRSTLLSLLSEASHERPEAGTGPTMSQLLGKPQTSWLSDRISFTNSTWQHNTAGPQPSARDPASGAHSSELGLHVSASVQGHPMPADLRTSAFYLTSDKTQSTDPDMSMSEGTHSSSSPAPESNLVGPLASPEPQSLMGLLQEGSAPVARSHKVIVKKAQAQGKTPLQANQLVNGSN